MFRRWVGIRKRGGPEVQYKGCVQRLEAALHFRDSGCGSALPAIVYGAVVEWWAVYCRCCSRRWDCGSIAHTAASSNLWAATAPQYVNGWGAP